ncbi:MAG: hypothetical protein WA584_09640 [Pyrinomonadaceae bacterium]
MINGTPESTRETSELMSENAEMIAGTLQTKDFPARIMVFRL